MAKRYDVIIIGAGIQGCATALNLALRKQRALLLDGDTPFPMDPFRVDRFKPPHSRTVAHS